MDMQRKLPRQAVKFGLVAVIALVLALPGIVPAAKRRPSTVPPYPGAITLTSLAPMAAIRETVTVEWTWKPGALVKSNSLVGLQISPNNGTSWTNVAAGLPIRNGQVAWVTKNGETTNTPDYAYTVRVVVEKTTINSAQGPIFVDNQAPEVHITHPTQGEVIIERDTQVHFATMVGTAELDAAAWDNLSGVQSITWKLDGDVIGSGSPFSYTVPPDKAGMHDLSVTATDRAGNESAVDTIKLLAIPGPSSTGQQLPDPNDLPSDAPVSPCPLPSQIPADQLPANPCPLPPAPVTSVGPCPLPSEIPADQLPANPCPLPSDAPAPPVGVPSDLPTAIPTSSPSPAPSQSPPPTLTPPCNASVDNGSLNCQLPKP